MNKVKLSVYSDYVNFINWCIAYCPKMLTFVTYPILNHKGFSSIKEEQRKKFIKNSEANYDEFLKGRNFDESVGYYICTHNGINKESAKAVISRMLDEYHTRNVTPSFVELFSNIPSKYIKILEWRCPLYFIRNFLAELGFKEKWYHRLFLTK